MGNRHHTGALAEELACEYLIENGFQIRHRNWQYRHKELDIVAQKNNTIHIVEVRSRTSPNLIEPGQSIDTHKQAHLLTATGAYLKHYKLDCEAQIDVISIIFTAKETKLLYMENAIYP